MNIIDDDELMDEICEFVHQFYLRLFFFDLSKINVESYCLICNYQN